MNSLYSLPDTITNKNFTKDYFTFIILPIFIEVLVVLFILAVIFIYRKNIKQKNDKKQSVSNKNIQYFNSQRSELSSRSNNPYNYKLNSSNSISFDIQGNKSSTELISLGNTDNKGEINVLGCKNYNINGGEINKVSTMNDSDSKNEVNNDANVETQ